MENAPLTIADWLTLSSRREEHRDRLHRLLAALSPDDPAFIYRATPAQLDAQLDGLDAAMARGATLPLRGVPFVAKDNIDVAGWPTTAACPEFRRIAARDAAVIARLRAAGAVVLAKANLDQFATGLVGTRSPYGVVPNTFDARRICGGSSSGSASAVARGLVPFSLGTDTAGSGRVPAGFNNLVGVKPTPGLVSAAGVVPACRTLDCVSVFSLTVPDGARVLHAIAGADGEDPWSRERPDDSPAALPERPRLAIPGAPAFFGDKAAETAWEAALAALEALGARLHPVDFAPFSELAGLLYAGPWVLERRFAADPYLDAPGMDPVVRHILRGAPPSTALDAFAAEYRRAELSARIHETLASVDALVVPTAPRHYTLDEIRAEPLLANSRLGTYTNFANLAGLCALALPGPFRADDLPAGITLLAPGWRDEALLEFGVRWERSLQLPLGATGHGRGNDEALPPASGCLRIAVVGAHLRGMPLNHELVERGARHVGTTCTAPRYRLHALKGTTPPKPGLVRVTTNGAAIEVELWDLPRGRWGDFMAGVKAPLGVGTVELADGSVVHGFLCESWALEGAEDISRYGGWRSWRAAEGA